MMLLDLRSGKHGEHDNPVPTRCVKRPPKQRVAGGQRSACVAWTIHPEAIYLKILLRKPRVRVCSPLRGLRHRAPHACGASVMIGTVGQAANDMRKYSLSGSSLCELREAGRYRYPLSPCVIYRVSKMKFKIRDAHGEEAGTVTRTLGAVFGPAVGQPSAA